MDIDVKHTLKLFKVRYKNIEVFRSWIRGFFFQ